MENINTLPFELFLIIIRLCFNSNKIVITDAPISLKIKSICRYWNKTYKFLFNIYGTKYILIEPFSVYEIKSYEFIPFTISIEYYDDPIILINYRDQEKKINLLSFGHHNDYATLVTKEEFKRLISICDFCKKYNFCQSIIHKKCLIKPNEIKSVYNTCVKCRSKITINDLASFFSYYLENF